MARSPRPIRSAEAYAKLSSRQRDTYDRVLAAAREMRRGSSARAAAKRAGTTQRTMKRYLGADMQRTPNGRYKLRRDRAYRRMEMLTNTSPMAIEVSRRDASIVGRHWNAVRLYLETGDTGRKALRDNQEALSEFLKVLANATSYGIYAEMRRRELADKRKERITVHGKDKPLTWRPRRPRPPGATAFRRWPRALPRPPG